MADILDDLTDAQREAVTHINGPLLVIAGPGSGKTRVITRRVAHLLYCGIRPWDILAITFTNKAAAEMRERVEALTASKGVWLSTFHAFAARVLREYADRLGFRKDFTIYDSEDSKKALTECMKDIEISAENHTPKSILDAISTLKERCVTPEDCAGEAQDYFSSVVSKCYAAYAARLKAANAFDFDDLIMKTAQLLKSDADALARLRRRHQFVMVDEFQDTSRSQYLIASLIAKEHRNLCATGDPDQSIYGWRGADINNILDFEKDFPEARAVYLDRNYRSTRTIVAAANAVVADNVLRKQRTLTTENEEGEKIRLVDCVDSGEEAAEICRTAKALIRDGLAPRDIAVFYRVNSLSRAIEQEFVSEGLPYQVVGSVEFYGRKEVKDVLGYLRLAANPSDEASLVRVVNTPPRGIGPKSVDTLRLAAAERGLTLFDAVASEPIRISFPPKAQAALAAFAAVVGEVAAAGAGSAAAAVKTAIDRTGYRRMLAEAKEPKERLENLDELINAAAQYDEANPQGFLQGFLEQAALVSDIDSWHEREDRVTLMTVHAAKGLEFPAVLVAGLDEGIMPYAFQGMEPRDIEEERRIFFVALTRAKKTLYLFRADRRMVRGMWLDNFPSRFLKVIPAHLIEIARGTAASAFGSTLARPHAAARPFAPAQPLWRAPARPPSPVPAPSGLPGVGTRVKHPTFGVGVIRSITSTSIGHKADIYFQHAGDKKVIIEKAGLEIVGEE